MGNRGFVIGVAGGTGSDKTRVNRRIQEADGLLHIARLQHGSDCRDHSHLPPDERAACNDDHPDGPETPLLLQPIRQQR